jgi:hypothetical protein
MARVEAAASKTLGAKILDDMPDFRAMGMNAHQVSSSMMAYNRSGFWISCRAAVELLILGWVQTAAFLEFFIRPSKI